MAYTKAVTQTGFAANLLPGEYVVKLTDTTPNAPVAVRVVGSVDSHTGNIVADAYARVVNANGTDYLDVNGQPLKSTFQTSMDRAGIAQLGTAMGLAPAAALKRAMLLTVIGEPAGWVNSPAVDALAHASIRTNIASAQDAASSSDPSTLL
jgi:hypothetical protein